MTNDKRGQKAGPTVLAAKREIHTFVDVGFTRRPLWGGRCRCELQRLEHVLEFVFAVVDEERLRLFDGGLLRRRRHDGLVAMGRDEIVVLDDVSILASSALALAHCFASPATRTRFAETLPPLKHEARVRPRGRNSAYQPHQ